MEVLFSIKTGSFPLYVPGFASGHSSIALTLGQFFHPLSYIASIMPGYWEGKAIEWNNFLKLLSLGLTQLALFAFLRKMRLNAPFSFLLSFITVYNLRMVDLFRHGTPLEGYSAYLVLCAVIGWYFINPKKWIGPLSIIGITYLLVCNGHPEEMYYGLLGAGLFALVAPYYLSTILHQQVDSGIAFKFWLKVGLCLCLGILLSSAYIVPFYFDFIKTNMNRVGQDYKWADGNLDTVIGTLNNFLLPLRSEANSAFGGSSLTLMAVILPALLFFKVKIPRPVWVVWGLWSVMFIFMQGSRTPVHRFVWEYLPFASSIRVAGRISIIIPFFMMLLLAWLVKVDPVPFRFRGTYVSLKPVTILACLALLFLIIYYLSLITGYYIFSLSLFKKVFFDYSVGSFLNFPFFTVELITVICGMAALMFLASYSLRTAESGAIVFLLIMVTLIQLGITLKFRSAVWIDKKYDSPSFEAMQRQKTTDLEYLYYPGGGLHSSAAMNQLKRSFAEPFLGKIFTYVVPVTNQEEAYMKMAHERLPQQVFVEGYNPQKAAAVTQGAKDMKDGSVELVYSSFNRLRFRVNSEAPAFFGFSYPYTGHWNAWLNDEKVHLYRANGAAQAIEIPAGESLIEFRYWSNAYFGGIVISSAAFAVIGLFVCSRALKGLLKLTGTILILMLSVGGFMLWYHSLYNGKNLETQYAWTYSPPLETPNIAYGKIGMMVYEDPIKHWADRERDYFSSRLVDGNTARCSGFISRLHFNPAWSLDLSQVRDIKTIVLHESCQKPSATEGALNWFTDLSNQYPPVNVRPLKIALSSDGTEWRTVASLTSPVNYGDPEPIFFDEPQTARYIRIEATGTSKLLFDEVEVYGP